MWRSIFVLTAVAAAACSRERNEAPPATTTLTGASVVTSDAAIDRIVTARCARDAACSNVGLNRDFAKNSQCEPKITARLHEKMSSECTNGVDGDALQRCLTAIDTESCDNPLDELTRQNDCRPGNLCLKAH